MFHFYLCFVGKKGLLFFDLVFFTRSQPKSFMYFTVAVFFVCVFFSAKNPFIYWITSFIDTLSLSLPSRKDEFSVSVGRFRSNFSVLTFFCVCLISGGVSERAEFQRWEQCMPQPSQRWFPAPPVCHSTTATAPAPPPPSSTTSPSEPPGPGGLWTFNRKRRVRYSKGGEGGRRFWGALPAAAIAAAFRATSGEIGAGSQRCQNGGGGGGESAEKASACTCSHQPSARES
jgi:hypothetical protein